MGGRAFEFGAVPVGEIGGGVVGGLAEGEEIAFGRVGEPDDVVHEKEFGFFGAIESFCGLNGAVLETWRLGCGVGVKGGVFDDFAIAGPEADADEFVGVAFFYDGIGAGTDGGAASRETRDGEIEAAPEEMHGAGFAEEAGAEFFEDGSDGGEDLSEAVGVFGVVGGVSFVESEADGAGDFHGHVPHFCVDAEGMESGHEFLVEGGDGAWDEAEGTEFAEAGLDFERVVDEIEVDFEDAFVVGNGGGGEAAGGDVESGAPPMIEVGAEGEADLADDLRPHVEGGAGVFPFG